MGNTGTQDIPAFTTGTATLSGGTVTISASTVTANSRILLTGTWTTTTSTGALSANTIIPGVSFKVNSNNILDGSSFTYMIVG